jgi:hypothetical protein
MRIFRQWAGAAGHSKLLAQSNQILKSNSGGQKMAAPVSAVCAERNCYEC